MKKYILILLASILMVFNSVCYSSKVIKIAILDNFKYQKYVTTKYKKYYVEGLEVAVVRAKELGYSVEYKIFQYDQNPLSVISEIPSLLAWNPDFIIGPRDSNKFLMLSPYIQDTLTISPFATSSAVKDMPSNFASNTLADKFEAKAIFNFINWKFKNRNIVIITEADCKSCNDVSHELTRIWLQKTNLRPYIKYFTSQQASVTPLCDLLKFSNENSIFVLVNNAHISAVLMARIAQMYSESAYKTVFVGGDGWGSWQDTEVGKLGDVKKYKAYHVVPWGLEICSDDITNFKRRFKALHGEEVSNKLSYVVYQTAMSVISSYRLYGKGARDSVRNDILYGYKMAILKNGYWYKPTDYLVYEIYNKGNYPSSLVNVTANKVSGFMCGKYE